MEQVKSNISAVVIGIIITAIVVGGGVYFWQQNQAKQPTANELTKAKEENKEPTVLSFSLDNKLHYENSTYNFSLDFPETWKKYTITTLDRDRGATGIPGTASYRAEGYPAVASFRFSLESVVFTITVYTKEQFAVLTKADPNGGPYMSNGKMAENNSYVFTAYGDEDAETSAFARTADVSGILKTLSATSTK